MKIKKMIYYALFAALTGILSQISIALPFTPVPINLALASVLIAGGLLGAKGGGISQLIYVLIGALGVPIFAKFSGGLGVLAGPTGGYIIGYILAAFIAGALISKCKNNVFLIGISMVVGTLACYLLGTAYFMLLTKNSFQASLSMCIIPFLPGDILKIILSSIVVKKIKVII